MTQFAGDGGDALIGAGNTRPRAWRIGEPDEDPNVAEKCYGLVRILHRGDTISLRLPGDRALGVPVADWLPEAATA